MGCQMGEQSLQANMALAGHRAQRTSLRGSLCQAAPCGCKAHTCTVMGLTSWKQTMLLCTLSGSILACAKRRPVRVEERLPACQEGDGSAVQLRWLPYG